MAHSPLENLPHLLCVLDFQGNIKQVNNSAWQQLGILAEYLTITKFTHWIHPDDFAHTQKALSKLYSKKSERVMFESRWRDIKGKYRWFFWIATVSLTEKSVHIVGLKINAPEQSSLSSSYQKSSFQLCNLQAAIWTTTNDAILVTNTQLHIVKANPACTSFMGYTPQELINKPLQDFNTGQQDAQFYQQIIETMSQKGHWQGSIWQRHKNQAIYTCYMKLQAYDTEDGKTNRHVVILGNKKTSHSAGLDPLTNLPTRHYFNQGLHKTLAKAQRHKKFFAILLISIDNILATNTHYGGAIGDQFVCAIGENLISSVRDSDTVARYDGDQFSVKLEEVAKPQDAILIAQVILFKLTQVFVLKKQKLQGSVSIGVVVYPEDGTEVDSLLTSAEHALQQAQQQGGNQYYFSNPALQE